MTTKRISLANLPKALQEEMRFIRTQALKATRRTAQVGARIISQAAPIDQGDLRKDVLATDTANGARIRSGAPHAEVVEVGSRPHRPPIEPLEAWAARKGFPDPRKAAFAIAAAIAVRGTTPTFYVRGSLPLILLELRRNLAIELEKAA